MLLLHTDNYVGIHRTCWGFWCRLGLCRFEDDLNAKLMQVGVDLLKVAGGFIGEHEDKQQDARMTGEMLSRLLKR